MSVVIQEIDIFHFEEKILEVNLENRLLVVVLKMIVKCSFVLNEYFGYVISKLNLIFLIVGKVSDCQ